MLAIPILAKRLAMPVSVRDIFVVAPGKVVYHGNKTFKDGSIVTFDPDNSLSATHEHTHTSSGAITVVDGKALQTELARLSIEPVAGLDVLSSQGVHTFVKANLSKAQYTDFGQSWTLPQLAKFVSQKRNKLGEESPVADSTQESVVFGDAGIDETVDAEVQAVI